jgi:hypothetical protein
MTVEGKLLQAESDLLALFARIRNALPIMQRAVDDTREGWHKNTHAEILTNLREAIENAEQNQRERIRE